MTKQKKLEELKKETVPFYLDKLDAAANENDGYLALGRVSFSIAFEFERFLLLRSPFELKYLFIFTGF